jgi:hypothetical protein
VIARACRPRSVYSSVSTRARNDTRARDDIPHLRQPTPVITQASVLSSRRTTRRCRGRSTSGYTTVCEYLSDNTDIDSCVASTDGHSRWSQPAVTHWRVGLVGSAENPPVGTERRGSRRRNPLISTHSATRGFVRANVCLDLVCDGDGTVSLDPVEETLVSSVGDYNPSPCVDLTGSLVRSGSRETRPRCWRAHKNIWGTLTPRTECTCEMRRLP